MREAFRNEGRFWRAGRFAVVATLALLGAACGSDEQKSHSVHSSSKPHKAKAATATAEGPAKPGEQPLGDMVAAVSAAKGPPFELKFALPVRPEVGQVTEIDVALVPSQPIPDSVSIAFQVVEGLEIVDGSRMERVEKLNPGTPIRHVVKVLPKRDGIFAITAVVTFTASNLESSRTFAIPVIAGVGLPDQVAKGP